MSSNRLTVSATQLSTAESCLRKWWFKWGQRLPEVEKDYFTFGTVLHAVIERFMSADELGRDRETGQPIDLYPPGWDSVPARGGGVATVTAMEADLIKRMIAKAIDTGLIVRDPKAKIEHKFSAVMDRIGDVEVVLTGSIDWMDDTGITDHKTMKDFRYALGPVRLAKDLQLLTYAAVYVDHCESLGRTIPAQVRLRHNQFSKDPSNPEVRFSETYVDYSAIAAQHERNKATAEQMLGVRDRERWDAVPGPNDPGACKAYGGCGFMSICAGKETVENYTKRVLKVNSKSVPSKPTQVVSNGTETGVKNVPTFEEMLAKRRAAQGGQTQAQPETQPKTTAAPAATHTPVAPAPTAAKSQPVAQPATVAKLVGAPPPWADPACKACVGSGFSSQGRPCRVCDALAKPAGRKNSSEFSITVADGAYVWCAKDGGTPAATSSPVVPVEVKQTEKVSTAPASTAPAAAPAAPAPATMPEAAAVTDPQPTTIEKIKPVKAKAAPAAPAAPQAPEEEAPVADDEDKDILPSLRRGRGRPVKSFTLFVNCYPTRGFGRVVPAEEVLREAYAKVVAEWNRTNPTKAVESAFELNAFARRDAAKVVIPKLLAQLSSADNLVVTTRDPDMVDAIGLFRSLATSVVEATS